MKKIYMLSIRPNKFDIIEYSITSETPKTYYVESELLKKKVLKSNIYDASNINEVLTLTKSFIQFYVTDLVNIKPMIIEFYGGLKILIDEALEKVNEI